MKFPDRRPRGKGYAMKAFTKRMRPVLSSNNEPYVCRVCGTELLYRMRTYKYYGNKTRSYAEWCPICLKFRDASTRILQSRYYEGMPGRVKYG